MFKFAAKPLPIGKIYGQSFVLYKEAFSKMWYLILLAMFVALIAQLVTGAMLPSLTGEAMSKLPPGKVLATLTTGRLLAISGFGLAMLLAGTYLSGLILHRLCGLGSNAILTTYDSCLFVFKKLAVLIAVKLIIFVLVVLGMMAFVLPGIAVMVLLIFALPEVLLAHKGIFGAIAGSCQLVWKNWWRTFAVLLAPGIIVVISAFLQQRVLHPAGALVFALFFVAFDLLAYAFILVQYNDLKLRKAEIKIEKSDVR